MKRIHILVGVLIILSVGAASYFLIQGKVAQTTPETTGVDQESAVAQDSSSVGIRTSEASVPDTELWVITTKFNTVFIQNASDNREAYESSYAKIVSVSIPSMAGIKIFDSRVSMTDPNTFFVTAEISQGGEAAYILNTQQKTSKVLFSNADHPDFKLAGIGSISPDENAILFSFASCRECDGGIIGGAVYNISTKAYKNIGPTPVFRWVTGTTFEYKAPPTGCEAYFANPFNGEGPKDSPCDKKIESADWVRESI